jgi:hypothetical protein
MSFGGIYHFVYTNPINNIAVEIKIYNFFYFFELQTNTSIIVGWRKVLLLLLLLLQFKT